MKKLSSCRCPPECLGSKCRFSSKSDVWSMSVTFWEVFSVGLHPKQGYEIDKGDMLTYLKNYVIQEKRHLPRDGFLYNCPREFYDRVMLASWIFDPAQRLTLEQANNRVYEIYQEYRNKYA